MALSELYSENQRQRFTNLDFSTTFEHFVPEKRALEKYMPFFYGGPPNRTKDEAPPPAAFAPSPSPLLVSPGRGRSSQQGEEMSDRGGEGEDDGEVRDGDDKPCALVELFESLDEEEKLRSLKALGGFVSQNRLWRDALL